MEHYCYNKESDRMEQDWKCQIQCGDCHRFSKTRQEVKETLSKPLDITDKTKRKTFLNWLFNKKQETKLPENNYQLYYDIKNNIHFITDSTIPGKTRKYLVKVAGNINDKVKLQKHVMTYKQYKDYIYGND